MVSNDTHGDARADATDADGERGNSRRDRAAVERRTLLGAAVAAGLAGCSGLLPGSDGVADTLPESDADGDPHLRLRWDTDGDAHRDTDSRRSGRGGVARTDTYRFDGRDAGGDASRLPDNDADGAAGVADGDANCDTDRDTHRDIDRHPDWYPRGDGDAGVRRVRPAGVRRVRLRRLRNHARDTQPLLQRP